MNEEEMERYEKELIVSAKLPVNNADPWRHRTEGMRCKTCISYVQKNSSNPDAPEIGRCRKHAPTMSGFPVVYPLDWCGDHRVDENKL